MRAMTVSRVYFSRAVSRRPSLASGSRMPSYAGGRGSGSLQDIAQSRSIGYPDFIDCRDDLNAI